MENPTIPAKPESNVRAIKRIQPKSVFKIVLVLDFIFVILVLAPMARLILNFGFEVLPIPFPPGTEDVIGILPWILIVVHPIGIASAASLGAVAYNILASITGGIKVELE